MAKYRRKQADVDAVQFVDGRYGEAIDFCPMLHVTFGFVQEKNKNYAKQRGIDAAEIEGAVVMPGDWIIKDAEGKCTVMSDMKFNAEYEPA